MKKFNVILERHGKFVPFDVIEPLVYMYNESKLTKPKNISELKQFVIDESRYRWWGRCEYEVILSDWPSQTKEKKIDVHWQVEMNLDLIVEILAEELGIK